MKSGRDFVQACNAHAAADTEVQLTVAQSLSCAAADARQLAPIVKQIKADTTRQAEQFSADAGHCSDGNIAMLARRHSAGYVATGRQRHAECSAVGRRRVRGGTRVGQLITVARSRSGAL